MIARMVIPMIKVLDTPAGLTATALDDAALAVPAVEDGEGPTEEGLDPGSSVDVDDPVRVLPDGDMDGAMLDVGVAMAVEVGLGTGIPVPGPEFVLSLSWS